MCVEVISLISTEPNTGRIWFFNVAACESRVDARMPRLVWYVSQCDSTNCFNVSPFFATATGGAFGRSRPIAVIRSLSLFAACFAVNPASQGVAAFRHSPGLLSSRTQYRNRQAFLPLDLVFHSIHPC